MINNPKLLDELINRFGHDRLRREGADIEPVFGSYYKNILAFQHTSRVALRSAQKLVLVLMAIVFVCSYLLGTGFLILSTVLFCIAGLVPISNSAQNNIVSDVNTILLNVYKWNLEHAAECAKLISSDAPWLRTTLVAVKKIG